ncbi:MULTISPECIES: stage III sporulation protein AD [Gracilibacillus]|uniref:Stage III sporulation protein AD n=2 Tax=Gracilibacillus TaxID=74385 RepID=A0ABY4GP23_9BACI|nr:MULTISPECIES: stage III sporulation protein AD [Gracilibacillus]UOQ47478.1 stage III sporulation protein AD [Gracilibacillus caseinilyticus]UOQ85979.1 stage III sporulation protein AD [Gracilibacillus salinarum]
MEIFEVISVGIITSVLFLLLKDKQPSIAFLIVVLTVLYFFIYVMQYVHEILNLITYLGEQANIDAVYIKTILQIIGISYITDIGANIVKDAGLESIAVKIEMIGKVFILILAIPIFKSLIETIINIFPIA